MLRVWKGIEPTSPGQEVLFHPGAAGFLEFVVGGFVLGRGEAVDPGRVGEGD